MTKVIVSNQIECSVCGDRPYSAHTHDFKWCSCGNVAVDGGCNYLKRTGGEGDYKELSMSFERESLDKVIQEAQDMIDSGRNARGIVYGVLRALRNEGLLNNEEEN